jgi:uncharacterized paraquat-inducible protein A
MIKVDFELALAVYLSFTVGVVLWRWASYTYSARFKALDDVSMMRSCPYCAYVFYEFQGRTISMCPRCHSYVQEKGPKKFQDKHERISESNDER